MNKKIAKYIIAGVKADDRKKFEAELKKVKDRSDKRYKWWQEEEQRANALESEIAALKAELADAKKVIAGYKETMEQKLGISEEEQNA